MRHERMVILLLAYIIGFVTAYIWFGLSPREVNAPQSVPTPTQSVQQSEVNNTKVIFNPDGMFVDVAGTIDVISGKLQAGIAEGAGFHVAIPQYSVSPDGRFVYYCEQQYTDEDVCMELVYDVQNKVVHKIMINEVAAKSKISSDGFRWSETGLLMSGSQQSIASDTPWTIE